MNQLSLPTIYKAGALIFDSYKRVLAVHKRGKPAKELIVPGGKIEGDETDEQTLRRELYEELNVDVLSIYPYGIFQAKAIYEEALLVMRTYIVNIKGIPVPGSEIDQLVWLDANYGESGFQYASILGQQIMPRLFAEGLLGNWNEVKGILID
ncbi:NUDIX hydrolase [Legionella bononiensis]|uniref:8-oxo-dGTP diphosphatase n=1 Tax=Legionella bononiensis TaxID=2793102 RepID=A0ABS1WAN6_9GAMM|nr:NUDIX domain-containing protein [Legionella bononiensis]MBL7480445.1 NUDIX domain-containing protein [Legionella bononiensis]MBL7526320.1 NUDIX domain-containing protein [Legionella bononiensis]MBL7563185.1 NUDIX domain-containing protein [Legionella bononiensis]